MMAMAVAAHPPSLTPPRRKSLNCFACFVCMFCKEDQNKAGGRGSTQKPISALCDITAGSLCGYKCSVLMKAELRMDVNINFSYFQGSYKDTLLLERERHHGPYKKGRLLEERIK